MGTFLVYIIKSALCLTLLYLPYTLLLRKERLHRLNRMALLAILAASFLFPLSQEEWFGGMWHSWQSAAPEGAYAGLIDRLGRTELFMPEVVIMPDADVPVWPWCVSVFISQVWRCRCPSVCTSSSVCIGRYLAVVFGTRAFQTVLRSTVMPVPCRLSVGCTAL